MTDNNTLDHLIEQAFKEDVKEGDITSEAIFDDSIKATGKFLVKETGVLSGLNVAEKVFKFLDGNVNFKPLLANGAQVKPGDIAAEVEGTAKKILTAERTALNFMQRMSGIATAVSKYQSLIGHTKAKIVDTRKTVPGLRLLDKQAVIDGGGANHRMGLYDMFLIKDNHIAVAGSVTKAVDACKKFKKERNLDARIEVEVKNIKETEEALACGVDRIMLDNFEVIDMYEAVKLIDGRCEVEASGGITIESVKAIAETGVDIISSGALTHSVKALDISLELDLKT